MSVKVKRKLWIFNSFIPARIRFNNESVGTLYGSQEIEIPMQESEGELKYYQPVGRNDQLQVKKGDVVQVEELLLGKVLGILLVTFLLYLLMRGIGIIDFTNYSNYEQLFNIEKLLLSILFLIAVISLFFKTNKLVLLNR